MRASHYIIYLIILLPCISFAQVEPGFEVDTDTLETIDAVIPKAEKSSLFTGRPGRATLYSLILPGSGQVYNKQYVKAPLAAGAVFGMGLVVQYNTEQYKRFKTAYMMRIDSENAEEEPTDEFANIISTAEGIKAWRDRYDRYRQTSLVGLVLVWVANSAEAFVSAHLKDFDVSDDISKVRIRPRLYNQDVGGLAFGISMHF